MSEIIGCPTSDVVEYAGGVVSLYIDDNQRRKRRGEREDVGNK